MGASSEPVRPPCLDLPSSSLQLRTCALEGGTPDRRHPRPSGVHLRLRCPCPGPVHSPQPGPALASSSSGSGSGSAGAARAARGPSPSALGAPSFPLPLPPTCYSPPELHPIGRHHAARPSLPPVGPFPARGGASAARTGPRGRRPGWAGGAGRVTWAGGRWSAGAGRRGAAGGHFGGHRRPPPGPARGAARESILWPQPPRLQLSPPTSLSASLSALHLPPHEPARSSVTSAENICLPGAPTPEPPPPHF